MSTQTDYISAATAKTLYGLFLARVERSPERIAYRQYNADTDNWEDTSWQQAGAAVARWQAAMREEKLAAGDRVAIMLRNCREWVFYDQAAMGLGLVLVPLYVEDRAENVAYILKNSGARLLLLDSEDSWAELADACADNAALQTVISTQPVSGDTDRVTDLEHWLPTSGDTLAREGLDAAPDALATIVYTSGTTGAPKGVMLSHYNILWDIEMGLRMIPVYPDDMTLSFLPLSHTLERSIGYYLVIMAGGTVTFARSIPELAEDLVSQRPTILVAVPRIFERVYGRIQDQLRAKRPLARRLFQTAVDVGWSKFEHEQGREGWHPSLLLWPLLKKLVAAKVHAKLGGRMRFAICGGAALSPGVARLFIGLGLPVFQGYGLTETSPIISANRERTNKPASIGLPIDGQEVKILDNGELLVRGPNVMAGYWDNEAATRAAIEPDGWLHTGDKARMDDEGYLFITGRIKEILVLANGEKVPPADLELAVQLHPVIEQALLVGEARPFLGMLLVVNEEAWRDVAMREGIEPELDCDANQRQQDYFLQLVSEQLAGFPGYARVHKVFATTDAWTIDNGLLTPTMKLKRNVIEARYRTEIEQLYAGH